MDIQHIQARSGNEVNCTQHAITRIGFASSGDMYDLVDKFRLEDY